MDSCWERSTVLVTGASGVIGQALVDRLRRSGFAKVVAASSQHGDLTHAGQTTSLLERVRPDLVFHLAARVFGIMGNLRNRGTSFLDNIRINTNVVDACRLVGVKKIVAMGSTAIYSDLVKLPMAEDDLWLGAPHGSEAAYGHAKRAMLAQLEAYHQQYGLEYAFCISTNLYGPGDKFDEATGHVVPSLISKFHRAVQTGGPMEVWGDGSPQRDFLYAKDAAEALCVIAERGTGAINVASGAPISIRQCVETIAKAAHYDGEIRWDASKPNGQMMRDYKLTRLSDLGFQPRYTFAAGVAETFAWFEQNPGLIRR